MNLELVVMHHTDCGMSRLVDPKAHRVLGEKLGIEGHVQGLGVWVIIASLDVTSSNGRC